MARRKDRRRRPHRPPVGDAAVVPATEEPAGLEQAAEAAPERLSAPGGTALTVAVAAVSAALVGLLLSGWTPRSVDLSPSPGRPAATTPAPTPLPPAPIGGLNTIPAKNVFGAYCGICHTLAAVGAVGTVGPNLDELRPTKAQVLKAIRSGGLGTGQMPANILHGRAANRVAAYVAAAAGG